MRSGPGSSRWTVRATGRSERADVGNNDDRIRREGEDLAHMTIASFRSDPPAPKVRENPQSNQIYTRKPLFLIGAVYPIVRISATNGFSINDDQGCKLDR